MAQNIPLTVYGTIWCGDCRRTRHFLENSKIAYIWVDIDKDTAARLHVQELNHGNRSVPTLVFSDGTILVEPSNEELRNKLELF